jgi:hypothetical protein
VNIDPDQPATFPVDDLRSEAVADGSVPADPAAPGEVELAGWATAASAPAMAAELAGLDGALTAFAAATGGATPLRRPLARPLLRAGVAAAAATVLFAGTAAAAYTESLPEPLQQIAHNTIGAPQPGSGAIEADDDDADGQQDDDADGQQVAQPGSTATTPAGPTALPTPSAGFAGNSAAGLCRAWTNRNGDVNERSAVFRSLVALAGGPTQVPGYCADLPDKATGKSGAAPGKSADKGNKPDKTTGQGNGNGNGKSTGNGAAQGKGNAEKPDNAASQEKNKSKTAHPNNGKHKGKANNKPGNTPGASEDRPQTSGTATADPPKRT